VSAHILRDLCVRPDFRLLVGADLRVCPFPHDHPDNTWAHTQVCPYTGTQHNRHNRAHTQVRPAHDFITGVLNVCMHPCVQRI